MADEKIRDFFEDTKSLLETHKVQIERKVDNFFSSLQFRFDIFQTAKKEMDVYLACDFNVFDYIAPDENRLSDIIAGLLDPNGKHGQGDVFLREFLKVTGKSENYNVQKRKVIREGPTTYIRKSQRRIDITIDFGKSGIGLENKPWAGEQEVIESP